MRFYSRKTPISWLGLPTDPTHQATVFFGPVLSVNAAIVTAAPTQSKNTGIIRWLSATSLEQLVAGLPVHMPESSP
jgi:hypothetical protein